MTTSNVYVISTNNRIRAITLKKVLINGGAEGYVVPEYVVAKLKA